MTLLPLGTLVAACGLIDTFAVVVTSILPSLSIGVLLSLVDTECCNGSGYALLYNTCILNQFLNYHFSVMIFPLSSIIFSTLTWFGWRIVRILCGRIVSHNLSFRQWCNVRIVGCGRLVRIGGGGWVLRVVGCGSWGAADWHQAAWIVGVSSLGTSCR